MNCSHTHPGISRHAQLYALVRMQLHHFKHHYGCACYIPAEKQHKANKTKPCFWNKQQAKEHSVHISELSKFSGIMNLIDKVCSLTYSSSWNDLKRLRSAQWQMVLVWSQFCRDGFPSPSHCCFNSSSNRWADQCSSMDKPQLPEMFALKSCTSVRAWGNDLF